MLPIPESSFKLPEQSVVIEFFYGKDELDDLHALDIELMELIEKKGVGVYDFHEINMDGTDGRLFMYGDNAEILFKAVWEKLKTVDFMQGAVATLQFGPETNAKSIEIEI